MLFRVLCFLAIVTIVPTVKAGAVFRSSTIDDNCRVGSMQWRKGEFVTHSAVVEAGENERLTLVFDLLAPEGGDESWMPYLRCRLRHTDAAGVDDGLVESEFLDGFNIADIGYGEESTPGLTTVLYRHYSVEVPPAEMRVRLSGNYVIEIFEDGKPENVLISAPFAIEEGSVEIAGSVTGRTDTEWNGSMQQLELEVTGLKLDHRVGMQNLRLYIEQNGMKNSCRLLHHPSHVEGNKAVYAHMPELMFKAGNEYRRMETVSRKRCGMHVAEILWNDKLYHEILQTDFPRITAEYVYDQTQGGEFTVREADESEKVPSDLDADYTVVHFALEGSGIMPPDIVHIEGALTGRRIDSGSAMSYEPETGTWRKALLLKQGAYDYRYAVGKSEKTDVSGSQIEGDHHQTQNVYVVRAYYRLPGERTDRLAGVAVIRAEANL